MKIEDYLMENVGFLPFEIDGEIFFDDNRVTIEINNSRNEAFEKHVEKFFRKLLKRNITLNVKGDKDINYITENWNGIITGSSFEKLLRFVTPEISEKSENTIVLKTHLDYIISKISIYSSKIEKYFDRFLSVPVKIAVMKEENQQEYYNDEPDITYVRREPENVPAEKTDLIFGRMFKKVPIPIEKIPTVENIQVVIEGRVFYKDFNDRSKVLSLFLTDYTDSYVLKSFKDNAEKLNSLISEGSYITVEGKTFYDNFSNDYAIIPNNILKGHDKTLRTDSAEEKRVELHCHSKLSSMDAILEVSDIVNIASKWGHKAVAITDHGVVQSIPDFFSKATGAGIKPLFGIEAYVVDDFINIINLISKKGPIDDFEYVVFDFETTGLQPAVNEIIEIGAVKIINGEITEKYHKMIKPVNSVPPIITKITGITNEMLENEPPVEEVLPDFIDFIGDSVLVAHNADFDYRFLREWAGKALNLNFERTYIDTLSLSKSLLSLTGYSLDKVVKELKLGNFEHHRAHEDAEITGRVFLELIKKSKSRGINNLEELDILKKFIDYKSLRPMHMTILVKTRKGLRNLYELVSNAHLKYFYRVPRILKSELITLREGLLIGSGCENGELSEQFMRGATKDELTETAKFYDFIEIMPVDVFESRDPIDPERIKEMYRLFYDIAKELNIIPVMTGNVHYYNPNEDKFIEALKVADKKKPHPTKRFFRTTEEMLQEALKIFDSSETAKEIVITNSNKIADSIDNIQPLTKKLNPPVIDGAEDEVRNLSMTKAHEIYGDVLPEIVEKRLEFELNSIINNGYSVLYLMAERIVKKSNEDGYLVGSRGSVGSSFVATMMGITEVNPLDPHYVCPKCRHSVFITDGSFASGFDLPDKKCPKCSENMKKNGQSIPFATFMGFEGDKIPDIDLNFSGEYQSTAHKYVEEMFGVGHVFKAGTIATVAEKTALGYARAFKEEYGKYGLQEKYKFIKESEIIRIAKSITGVKRTTGQHPGGLMIVPKEFSVYDFTPIQRPANDQKSDVTTTHFDYHVIHDDLIKLDALGHDDPTFIKMLTDITGIKPEDIPMDDKDTMSIFSSSGVLKIDLKSELDTSVGTLGIPEFGTDFVRRMLEDTRPKTFADLIRISGLSHGTDVWAGNAQEIIKHGKGTISDVISCRDDIMNYLIKLGSEPKKAFFIMEKVRKGKGLSPEDEQLIKSLNVADWFIDSCKKIKYLFPKAHATAYVSMAFRIAYFKVHYPLAFYATYFSIKGDEFNLAVITRGKEAIKQRITEIKSGDMDVRKKSEKAALELALEMLLRGYTFKNVDLYRSDSKKFIIEDKSLLVPFIKIPNLGEKAAESVIRAREENDFKSMEELMNRTNLNKTNIETLKELNILKGLPEKNQMSLFGG